jgi:hypothetical protein
MPLYHIKGLTAKLDLCFYPVNLCHRISQDLEMELFSVPFISNYKEYLKFTTAVSTVLIIIVAPGGVAQVVDHLPSNNEALSSNSSTTKINK